MSLTHADHKTIRLILLQHAPHGIHIITCKSPIALRFKVAETQFLCMPQFDARHTVCDLAGHKFMSAARAFMVEQNTGGGKHVERLAIVDCDPVSIYFCHTIWAARIKGSCLSLRHFEHTSKHLTGRGLIKTDLWVYKAYCFKNSGNAQRSNITCQRRLVP